MSPKELNPGLLPAHDGTGRIKLAFRTLDKEGAIAGGIEKFSKIGHQLSERDIALVKIVFENDYDYAHNVFKKICLDKDFQSYMSVCNQTEIYIFDFENLVHQTFTKNPNRIDRKLFLERIVREGSRVIRDP